MAAAGWPVPVIDDEKQNLVGDSEGHDQPPTHFMRDDYGEGLKRFPGLFGGVVDDFRRRFPLYWSDITDAYTRKTLSASMMMFLATFCSTVALGSSISRHTDNSIGLSEYLLMNGIAGMVHALLGCQPLLILRPTGPITLMLTQIYALSRMVNVDFFTLAAWTGFGIGFWMLIIAGTEFSRHIAMLTRFAHDVFACFVSSIYVVDGITGVASRFSEGSDPSAPLFALVISSWLVMVAMALSSLRTSSRFLPKSIRFLLADYALSIATFTATALSYAYYSSVEVERIEITGNSGHGWTTAKPTLDGRDWAINVLGGDNVATAVLLGLTVSIPITIFFYFDQNFSSLLCQTKQMNLEKGSYYHSSFAWMGIFNIVGPLFGLPFVTGSLPHSPQMVRALTNDEASRGNGPAVCENRISPFLMYAMILLSYLAFSGLIELIPVAAADAVLIYVGLEGIFDTQLWTRLPVLITPDSDCPPEFGDPWAARKFTLLQLAVIGAGWGLNMTPAALAFPLVIACLVPIRAYVLPTLFSPRDLKILDGEDAPAKKFLEDEEKDSEDKGASALHTPKEDKFVVRRRIGAEEEI
mmetsp:Transcript_26242/g.51356  ORF Transcript_26242/g.51356 Transcript_26242/m.51356 type:complete len:582 (+) Transcript_26242:27-1772(+)